MIGKTAALKEVIIDRYPRINVQALGLIPKIKKVIL
jgi:hypothetical protein